MPIPMREVTKAEFETFIAAYPRALERHRTTICEPMQLDYNDFTLGNWPESMVAAITLYEEYPKLEDGGKPPYAWKPNKYRIRDPVKAPPSL